MPATTPNLSIPYPLAADSVASYPALAKQQAEKIEALVYDSGWVNVPLASGITAQSGIPFQVRRIGSVVYPRWGVNSAGIALSRQTLIGTVPAGFRPLTSIYIPAATNTANMARANIEPNGTIYLSTPATSSAYYLIYAPWPIS